MIYQQGKHLYLVFDRTFSVIVIVLL